MRQVGKKLEDETIEMMKEGLAAEMANDTLLIPHAGM